MLIPHKKKDKVNKIQYVLSTNKLKEKTKKHIFYKLITDLLDWAINDIKQYDLEDSEIQSELFILSCKLFNRFDETKSSLIPYLEKQIDWELSRLFKKLNKIKDQQDKTIYDIPEESYEIEIQDIPENVIFQDSFIFKSFTHAEKYVIQEIMFEESSNYLNLSEKLGIDRRTIKNKVDKIKEKLEVLINV